MAGNHRPIYRLRERINRSFHLKSVELNKPTRSGVSEETDDVDRFKLLLLVPKLDDLVLAPIGRLDIVEVVDDFRLGVGSVSSRLLRNGRQFINDDV